MLWTLLLGQITTRPVVPEGLGVNAHFDNPPPEELARVHAAGFRWVRTDLLWTRVEPRLGVYDFRSSDRLLAGMKRAGLRLIWILDYDNPIYGVGPPIRGGLRAGYLNFVRAVMRRYQGKGIVWEIWNEPDTAKFWHARPDPYAYAALARAVRAIAPRETLIGPAASGFDFGYLNRALGAGLAGSVDAISVHPYRFELPESVTRDYKRLQALVRWQAHQPVICSEWGYGIGKEVADEASQAQALLRIYFVNLEAGAPVTILYNWTDTPGDSDPRSRGYGVTLDGKRLKVAYTALANLTRQLNGFRFVRRLPSARGVHLLEFRRERQTSVVGWVERETQRAVVADREVTLDGLPRCFPIK